MPKVLIDQWNEYLYGVHYEVKIYQDEKGEVYICAILDEWEWQP